MSSDEIQGYPIRRNNTCNAEETACGHTWGTFHACCPGNSQCLDSKATKINNFICCPNSLNCASVLAESPTCADTTWDLYNSTGYFCCEPQHPGFSVQGSNSVGCLDPDTPQNESYNALKPSSTGTSIATSTSTSTGTSTGTSTSAGITTSASASASSSSNSPSTNTGAIAGGVVGGVVGAAALGAILFFWIRRRKHRQPQQELEPQTPPTPPPFAVYPIEKDATQPSELGDGRAAVELSDSSKHPAKELHELPTAS